MNKIPLITITLPLSEWEEIAEAARSYQDEGPCCEGWQSSKLWGASDSLDAALALHKKELP